MAIRFCEVGRPQEVIEVAIVKPTGNILDIWDAVLEPFDQDKEEHVNREGDTKREVDEDDDEVINLEEERAEV